VSMSRCQTDCVEKPLRMCFEMMGSFIGSHPWWFLFAPLIVSSALGSGFYFLQDGMSNDIEEQFTPADGPAKMERKYVEETFPRNCSMFSSLRLSTAGSYGTVIATSDGNILTTELLHNILDLDLRIRSMQVEFGNHSFEYGDICAKVMDSCASSDFLDIIEYNASNVESVNLTFPWYHTDRKSIPLYLSLGSVEVHTETSFIESAKAVQLHYYLEGSNHAKNNLWLESFISLLSNESSSSLQVSFSTSKSMQWEFERSPASVINLFSITYTVVVTFSILTCCRSDNVRTKVWVAFCGVLCTGLAILSGFGVMLLLGQPFVMTAASCPFMILGIGLDDMFIMISCWQRSRVLDTVPDRMGATYRDASVSVTITTITDALSLFLGCSSPFGSVRSFCLYAGICVCFCYLYSITFLGACMALNGRREAENRHWFTCATVPEDFPSGSSKAFRACCVGGGYNRTTEKEETEPIDYFLQHFLSPCLSHKGYKVFVFLCYSGYLVLSIYGIHLLKEGLDIKNLALDDSYLIRYYNHQEQHFSKYGYNVMVAVKQPISYWDDDDQRDLNSCISAFKNLNFVNSTLAWFTSFKHYAGTSNLNISSKETFFSHLANFLELNPMFKLDLNLTSGKAIQASRFFLQTLTHSPLNEIMTEFRRTAEDCPFKLLVYHPAFIYFDQYMFISNSTIQTVLIAVSAMLLVSIILIPNPLCSICVAFAICSVVVGVVGFMSLWGVSLDTISMINLIMSIGFSVDFSAHISYAFVSSPKGDVDQKAAEALSHLGYPIMQGALSTILGVVVLSMSGSYIFRTFFKIMFLVISFGLLHGLVFIPVFLTLVGAFIKF
uniref:Patched domain-containing protein 3 n=1 Tax=Cyprinodon variegatus TaxID=28743 RepID=A0A3Q2DFP6_CYPVA